MLTQAELAALVQILNRAPVSAAEKLWLVDILNRLAQTPPSTIPPARQQPEPDGHRNQ
jgi:hypothetical protein